MKVHLNEILDHTGLHLTVSQEGKWLKSFFNEKDDLYAVIRNPIDLDLDFQKVSDDVIITGSFETVIHPECVRCTEGFDLKIAEPFNVTVFKNTSDEGVHKSARNHGEDKDVFVGDEWDNVDYYENDEIEMLPIVGENFVLAVPAYFLCKEECKGLCQYCGVNKNNVSCGCDAKAEAEAAVFGVLKQYKM